MLRLVYFKFNWYVYLFKIFILITNKRFISQGCIKKKIVTKNDYHIKVIILILLTKLSNYYMQIQYVSEKKDKF